MGEVRGAPGCDIGMNTFALGPTVTGLWMARGEADVGEKQPAGVVDLDELLRVTVKIEWNERAELFQTYPFSIPFLLLQNKLIISLAQTIKTRCANKISKLYCSTFIYTKDHN